MRAAFGARRKWLETWKPGPPARPRSDNFVPRCAKRVLCDRLSGLLIVEPKTRDNIIYLGIGGTIAAALAFYIFYTDRVKGRIPEIPPPLLWGILSTPGIVALILERFWRHRRRPTLWVILIAAASSNVLAMVAAYSWRWNPPVIFLSTMTALWVVVIFIVAEKLLSRERRNRKGSL